MVVSAMYPPPRHMKKRDFEPNLGGGVRDKHGKVEGGYGTSTSGFLLNTNKMPYPDTAKILIFSRI